MRPCKSGGEDEGLISYKGWKDHTGESFKDGEGRSSTTEIMFRWEKDAVEGKKKSDCRSMETC